MTRPRKRLKCPYCGEQVFRIEVYTGPGEDGEWMDEWFDRCSYCDWRE